MRCASKKSKLNVFTLHVSMDQYKKHSNPGRGCILRHKSVGQSCKRWSPTTEVKASSPDIKYFIAHGKSSSTFCRTS